MILELCNSFCFALFSMLLAPNDAGISLGHLRFEVVVFNCTSRSPASLADNH